MNAASTDDHRSSIWILFTAGVMGALGVLIGAIGAHGLEAFLLDSGLTPARAAQRLAQFDVGARYHLVHAVALLALAALPQLSTAARWLAFGLFTMGIVLFSGSLYLLVLTDTTWLGAITPLGGIAWVAAWSAIAISALGGRPARMRD